MWIFLLLPLIYLWLKLKDVEKDRHLILGLLGAQLADNPEALKKYRKHLEDYQLMKNDRFYKEGYGGTPQEMHRQLKIMRSVVSLVDVYQTDS